MELEKLGFWLNDWGKIDKNTEKEEIEAVGNFKIFPDQIAVKINPKLLILILKLVREKLFS
jgi:hypothetical protein